MPLLFDIPPHLLSRVNAGEVVRYGAILKEARTGTILAHLQETGTLHRALANPLIRPFNPLGPAALVLGNFQLHRLDVKVDEVLQLLDLMNGMQVANLALAGLGIGINVAAFALINRRLDKLSSNVAEIHHLLAKFVDEIRRKHLVGLEDGLRAQLQHAEEGWDHNDSERVWIRVADELHDLLYQYESLIDDTFDARPVNLNLLAYLLQRYRTVASTRVQCLMLLNELEPAKQFSQRFSREANRLLDGVSPFELSYSIDEVIDPKERFSFDNHLRIRARLPRCQDFVYRVREFQDLFATLPSLIESLIDNGESGYEYVRRLKERADKELAFYIPNPG